MMAVVATVVLFMMPRKGAFVQESRLAIRALPLFRRLMELSLMTLPSILGGVFDIAENALVLFSLWRLLSIKTFVIHRILNCWHCPFHMGHALQLIGREFCA
jgi:hypothetical protein